MNHSDHVNLLRAGVPEAGGVWADFGAGRGAFTLALADLIGPGATIHAIDRDAKALQDQAQTMQRQFPQVNVIYHTADFTRLLKLPALDGMVIANALHFQRHQEPVVRLLRSYLRPGGRLLIVEYNIDHGNYAVPYPAPYTAWVKLAQAAGFEHTELLMTRPSRSLHEIYSATSW